MLREVLKRYLVKVNLKLTLLIFLGSLSWCLTMVKSGLTYPFGAGFWGANGHDGIWHIALAGSLARGSFEMPTFSGETLKNYHIGFDLILAVLNKITFIPITVLYFQIFPVILSVTMGIAVYTLIKKWRKNEGEAFWSTFFVYFGGSFGWIVNLIRDGRFGGESMFWSQQAISTLINPPFALSLILISFGLWALLSRKTVLAIILFGILIEIKAYAGILILGSLFVVGVWEFLLRKNLYYLKVFIFSLILSAIVFLPLNISSGSLLVFKPFWFLETMMGSTDRLGWEKFYSAMMNYRLVESWKTIPAYVVAFLIFCIGNFGTRLIKDIWIIGKLRKLKEIDAVTLILFAIIPAGILIPSLFLQAGTPWNTIQFIYYSLFASSILAAIVIAKLPKAAIALVVILTIPTSIITLLNDYLPGRPPAMISIKEMDALNFLKKQPEGVVLTYVFDEAKAKEAVANPPRPLYFYESTAYVSAYTNKSVYLEDQVNLDITGYNWRERRQKIGEFVSATDKDMARAFLRTNNIKYLYLAKDLSPLPGEKLKLGESQLGLTKIFDNSTISILRVD